MKTLAVLTCVIAITSSINLNCHFTYIGNCATNCYQCTVLQLIVTKPNQTINIINGPHLNNEENQDATTLRVINQVVNYIPAKLGFNFPNLLILKIWNSELNRLNQEDIEEFKFLTDLSVSGNNLEVLKSNLFQFNHQLKHIDFSRNRLQKIGLNLLKPLNKLVFADFYQNDCISEGGKFSFEVLVVNLRKNCKPTIEMMFDEMDSLNKDYDILKDNAQKSINKIKQYENMLENCRK